MTELVSIGVVNRMEIVVVRDTFDAPSTGEIAAKAGLGGLTLFPVGLLSSPQPAAIKDTITVVQATII
jgi:hypothetical protein